VKFLIDHNLSPKLVGALQKTFPGSLHTTDLGFDRTNDGELYRYAKEHGYHILTKDSDFQQMSVLLGAPPKVVWLRMGNAPTQVAVDLLALHHEALVEFLMDQEGALLALGR
jgi:predicted nuclease of predicted toxin-antitoxin system